MIFPMEIQGDMLDLSPENLGTAPSRSPVTASVTSPAAAVPPWAGWKRSCRAAAAGGGVVEFTNKNWGMLSRFITPITIWFMVDKI